MYFHFDGDDDASAEKHERKFSNREVAKRLLPFFRDQAGTFGKALLLLIVATAATVAGPQILRQVVNHSMEPGASDGPIIILSLVFVAVVCTGLLLNYVMTLIITRGGLRIVTRLKERLFRHVMSLGLRFHNDYPPGRLLARVESDTESLKQLFSHAAIRLGATVFLFVGIIGVMLWQDPWTTLYVLAFVPVMGVLTFIFLRIIRSLYKRARRRYAEVSTFVTEYVQGVDVIQHHGYEPATKAKMEHHNRRRVRAEVAASYTSYGFWGLFAFFEILATAVVIAVGAGKVARNEMDMGTLVMFIEYLRQVFLPILMLSEFLNIVQQGFVAAERVFGILALEPDDPRVAEELQRYFGHGEKRGSTEEQPAPRPDSSVAEPVVLSKEIRFENVRFGYDDTRDVLHDVSFTIPVGQKVAVVGPSGGGKSTLANLLLYFYSPREGRITVDGVDLRDYSQKQWRHSVGLVLQGVHLFPGSVRDNLTVFNPAVDDDSIRRALDIVQAGPVIENIDGGLDGELAERGANLSHGERQLLSFARALVHDPPLLVLDEATASVDPVTERRIQASLDRMLAGRTAFIIAHRLATIVSADQIIVVQDGTITETGTHDELYANRNGHYRHLFDLQFDETSVDRSTRKIPPRPDADTGKVPGNTEGAAR